MTVQAIVPISKMQQTLATADTPQKSKELEEFSAAARAWAKEHQDYDAYVQSAYFYVMARRKTTELVLPHIKHGGHNRAQPDEDVQLLEDFGFTWKQWNRRRKELDLDAEQIESYFEECFSNGWWPSINGLFRFGKELSHGEDCTCQTCGHVHKRIGDD